MEMKHTYIYIISFFMCLNIFAQEEKENDTLKKHSFGIRVGTDLSKLVKSALIENYTAFEINADYKFSKKFNIAGEFGNENRTIDDTQVNFTAKGSYLKVGVDYNAYENWLDMENVIFLGLRYGASTHKQTLNSYGIYNSDIYWGEDNYINASQSFDTNTSHWLELVAGLKAEVWNNLYLGINVQLKNKLVDENPSGFENLYIPGFGRTYQDSNWGVGFGYTISYYIPFYKN